MRIGLVLNILDEEYQISLYRGIKQRASELGIQIICFQEGNKTFVADSFIGCFPRKEYFNLDGIILLTSVVFDNCMLGTKEDISRIWGELPVVSVGQKIQGVPSLLIHTDDSIKELLEHLIDKHCYKNFVYIGGTQTHHDSINREKLFNSIIKTAQEKNPEINYKIMHGNFTEQSAVRAMDEYFSKNSVIPDVVVCANDNMAIGVYKYLNLTQKSAEHKIAVTGFDDIPQGQFTIPPLTTVHQPLDKLGQEAVNMIFDLVQGKEVPLEKSVESHVIYRESCGCKKSVDDFETLRRSYEKMQSSYVVSEQMLNITSHVGRDLNNDNNEEDFVSVIDYNISMLGVNNFCILKFPKKIQADELVHKNLLYVRPVYAKINGKQVNDFPLNEQGTMTLGEFYEFISGPSLRHSSGQAGSGTAAVLKYLNVGNDYIGCILYDAPVETLPYIILISVDIALTLNRIEVNEKRKRYAENLEGEVLKISEIERQRFSNDLHDDICQRLAGISMLCRSYSKLEAPVKKAQMEELAELVNDTLQRTRQYAHNSYPVDLEQIGLNGSLANLCASFEQQSQITCRYDWTIPVHVAFDKTQKINIFRIVQEALHNVMKHSQAKNVEVNCKSLIEDDGEYIVVTVTDDGIGISEEKMNNFGIGLNSMQYRANQIGAEFIVALRQAQGPQSVGTTIQIKMRTE